MKALAQRLRRWLLVAAGSACLALAAIGVVTPGLPTTIFLILAAAAFTKSCPVLSDWMLRNRWMGPRLADWNQHHSIHARTKILIVTTIAVSASVSVLLIWPAIWMASAVILVAVAGCYWVGLRIPTREQPGGPFAQPGSVAIAEGQSWDSRQD